LEFAATVEKPSFNLEEKLKGMTLDEIKEKFHATCAKARHCCERITG